MALCSKSQDIKKIFYVNYCWTGPKHENLKKWWNDIMRNGHSHEYFPFPRKSWLVTKLEHIQHPKELFPYINITADGHKYLGSFIENEEAIKKFV